MCAAKTEMRAEKFDNWFAELTRVPCSERVELLLEGKYIRLFCATYTSKLSEDQQNEVKEYFKLHIFTTPCISPLSSYLLGIMCIKGVGLEMAYYKSAYQLFEKQIYDYDEYKAVFDFGIHYVFML